MTSILGIGGLADSLATFKQSLLADVDAMITGRLRETRLPKRVVNVPLVLGTQGIPLGTTNHLFLRLGLNGHATILSWSLAATVSGASASGSITLDVQVGSSMATLSSICGTNKPALAAQAELDDQAPTGWTTAIADPQWLLIKPTAADGVLEVVGLTLRMSVTAR